MLILETSACSEASVLATILFIKKLTKILSIIVPAILIVLLSIDIGKAVIASDDNDIKRAQKLALKRLIYGAIVFFVPMIVDTAFGLLDGKGLTSCYNNATDEVVSALQMAEKEKLIAKESDRQKLISAAKQSLEARNQQIEQLRENAQSQDSSSSGQSGTPSSNLSAIVLQSVEKIGKGIDSHNFVYSNNSPLAKTYDAALSKGLYKTNCALAVCWMYKDAGVISKSKKCFWFDKTKIHHKDTLTSGGKITVSSINRKTIKSLVSSGQLTPGDVIGTCDYRHTTLYKGKNSNGKYIFADAGHNAVKNKTVSGHSISGSKKVCILGHLK